MEGMGKRDSLWQAGAWVTDDPPWKRHGRTDGTLSIEMTGETVDPKRGLGRKQGTFYCGS